MKVTGGQRWYGYDEIKKAAAVMSCHVLFCTPTCTHNLMIIEPFSWLYRGHRGRTWEMGDPRLVD